MTAELLDELWWCLVPARSCTWMDAVEEAREIFDRHSYKPDEARRLEQRLEQTGEQQ